MLCELHSRKVWFDDRTANAICMAIFHPSSRIMIAALWFLLDYEKIEDDDRDDSDASSSEDDLNTQMSQILSKEANYKVKIMILKLIARTVGLHRLMLLNFYPFLLKYVQLHQRDITNLLAAAVQACHDRVPPDAVEPLFKQIVNQFIHDRSRPEAIAVGLNVIREICLRMPLLMTEDLLLDLVLCKKSHEKAVSAAARSLMVSFRELCPSLLFKKGLGLPSDPKAKPKSYGEVNVLSNIPGVELLEVHNDDTESEDGDLQDDSIGENDSEVSDDSVKQKDSDVSDNEEVEEESDAEEVQKKAKGSKADDNNANGMKEVNKFKGSKRKFPDFDGQRIAADSSLQALKRLAEEKFNHTSSDVADGILSNEDFQRIKELKAKKDAKIALARQEFKVPSSDQLSIKPRKLSKEERLALVKAGREEIGKYQA